MPTCDVRQSSPVLPTVTKHEKLHHYKRACCLEWSYTYTSTKKRKFSNYWH